MVTSLAQNSLEQTKNTKLGPCRIRHLDLNRNKTRARDIPLSLLLRSQVK